MKRVPIYLTIVLSLLVFSTFSSINAEDASKVNINTASVEELMSLPGIGESTANKIAEYRAKAKFSSVDQLMEIKGIGEKKYEKIKDMVTIGTPAASE